MAQIVNVNSSNYEQVVSKGIVLVDFWAPWCNPCRMLGTILDQVAAETTVNLVIAKVNIEEDNAIAAQFGVVSIPRLLLYKDGEIVQEFSGIQSKPKLLDAIANA